MGFNKNILLVDCISETQRICDFIRQQVVSMKRDGAVIGLSGGIDSALCSSLCMRALGKSKVLGLILPEKESNPISEVYAYKHANSIGLNTIAEHITTTLEGFGTYERRNQAIRQIFPEYDRQHKSKLVLPPNLLTKDAFNFFTLIVEDNTGQTKSARLTNDSTRSILSASNTKQIARMMYLNYYAEKNNYLVCGTTNRSEYVQGFFVKYGDGGVDIEPIAHLYKTQVYQLADYIGVIPEIRQRSPSPDTFTLEVTDEEMHFRIPFEVFDILLYAWEHNISASEVAKEMSLTEEQVKRVFRDVYSKYSATKYLRLSPQKLDEVNDACLVT